MGKFDLKWARTVEPDNPTYRRRYMHSPAPIPEVDPHLQELLDTLDDLRTHDLSYEEQARAQNVLVQTWFKDLKPELDSIISKWASTLRNYRWEESTSAYDLQSQLGADVAQVLGCPVNWITAEARDDQHLRETIQLTVSADIRGRFKVCVRSPINIRRT